MANVLDKRATCVQTTVTQVINGKADAMIVERRIAVNPRFKGLSFVELPWSVFPEGPLTFTVGLMEEAKDPKIAEKYITWLTSPEGEAHFERAGFISPLSDLGKQLVEKLGVKDA